MTIEPAHDIQPCLKIVHVSTPYVLAAPVSSVCLDLFRAQSVCFVLDAFLILEQGWAYRISLYPPYIYFCRAVIFASLLGIQESLLYNHKV